MTPEEAFLKDITEHPEDDTPRLIFADWLEERGDPRGEFIRLQVERSRLKADDSRQGFFLRDRLRQVLAEHGDLWRAPVAETARHLLAGTLLARICQRSQCREVEVLPSVRRQTLRGNAHPVLALPRSQ